MRRRDVTARGAGTSASSGSARDRERARADQLAVVGLHERPDARPDVPAVPTRRQLMLAAAEDPALRQLKLVRLRPDAEHLHWAAREQLPELDVVVVGAADPLPREQRRSCEARAV